jgi:FkbM family methyltransferase
MNHMIRSVKLVVRSMARRLALKHYQRYRLNKLGRSFPEAELRVLPYLCQRDKISLDIGASIGFYTAHLLRLSRRCVAFEPRPAEARELAAMLSSVAAPASVEAVALSDRVGQSRLRILLADPGRSTLENANLLQDTDDSDVAEISVPVRRLDDYALEDVGFVKIDVEGHEHAVLIGGRETIAKNRPALIIEIEERHRHNALADVMEFFAPLSYSAFFLNEGQLRPSRDFSSALHQDCRNVSCWKSEWESRGVYINNFIFIPSERELRFVRDIEDLTWG